MNIISTTHLARNLTDVVRRVESEGERYTVVRGTRVVAEIRPPARGRSLAELPEILFRLPHLTREDLDDLSRDLDQIGREVGPQDDGTAWSI